MNTVKRYCRGLIRVGLVLAGVLVASSAGAANYSWTNATASAVWDSGVNWATGSYPNVAGDVVYLTNVPTAAQSVDLHQSTITVGTLNLGSATYVRTLTNTVGGALVMDNGATDAVINGTSTGQGDVIGSPVQIAGNLIITNAINAATKPLIMGMGWSSSAASGTQTVMFSASAAGGVTFNGVISDGGNGGKLALAKAGSSSGVLTLNNANTFNGGLKVLIGSAIGYAQASGSPFGSATCPVILGGSDPLTTVIYNPSLTLNGLASPTVTDAGDLVANGTMGGGTLTVVSTNGVTTTLQFDSLVRTGTATLMVSGNLGVSNKVTFTGSGTTLVNGILPPWLCLYGPGTSRGDFATYGVNGLTNGIAASYFTTGDSNQVVGLTVDTNLTANQAAYAVRGLDGVDLNLNGRTLSIGDGVKGGLILNNNTTIYDTGAGAGLDFGSAEGLIFAAYSVCAIKVPISGTGGLTIFGPATLTITNANLYSGNISLQAYKVSLKPTNPNLVYSGNITGAGMLGVAPAGILTFTGTNTIQNLTFDASGGTLVLTNGSLLSTLNSYNYIGSSVTNATMILTGTGTRWDAGNQIVYAGAGNNASGNVLRVENGALLTNASYIVVGNGGAPTFGNSMIISNGAKVSSRSASTAIGTGSGSSSNRVLVVGGPLGNSEWELNGQTLSVGANGSSNNLLCVAQGGVITNVAGISLGSSTASSINEMLLITNGGVVRCQPSFNGVGSQSLIVAGGGSLLTATYQYHVGQNNSTGNLVRVDGMGVAGGAVVETLSWGGNDPDIAYSSSGGNCVSNMIVVTNGGWFRTYKGYSVGVSGAATGGVGENGLLVSGVGSIYDGYAVAGIPVGVAQSSGTARNNWLRFENGGVGTNLVSITVGSASGDSVYGNSLVISNGSALYTAGNSIISSGGGFSNWLAVVYGPLGRSLWNLGNKTLEIGKSSRPANNNRALVEGGGIEGGAVLTNISTLAVGSGAGTNLFNSLVVSNGGQVYATTLQVGVTAASNMNNSIAIGVGGLAQAGTLTVLGTNNTLSNVGGTYQFTSPTPTISLTANAGNSISVNNGTISFLNVTNVNVKGNWSASQLTNMTWGGTANTFRLNNATNGSATNQTYVFTASQGATNYAGLELVNGNTAYTNGSVTVAADGALTFSNTTAIVWGAVTNAGTLRFIDSTVTFQNGLVLQDTASILWSSNTVGNTVWVNGTLKVPASLTLTLPGTLAQDAQITLFQSPNAIDGTPNWTVNNAGAFKVTVSTDGKRLMVMPRAVGFMFIVE